MLRKLKNIKYKDQRKQPFEDVSLSSCSLKVGEIFENSNWILSRFRKNYFQGTPLSGCFQGVNYNNCDAQCNFVPLVQFKTRETPVEECYHVFKLYKWYQVAQSTTIYWSCCSRALFALFFPFKKIENRLYQMMMMMMMMMSKSLCTFVPFFHRIVNTCFGS